MTSLFDELNTQNDKITEISIILSHLITERSLCDNSITQALFFEYVTLVKEHLNTEDLHIFPVLLRCNDEHAQTAADNFMGGSVEIKRIFKSYLRKWCRRDHLMVGRKHEEFINDSRDMFRIVLERIQNETEKLYPMVRIASKEAA
ncbi:hypothetical protein [Candidatus Venteria ishoeyi]|uniref:Hemerythrin-like domain-containing protein n=1 Tax=Candidatus Venteria ishoeyi TaxID=1899563 RepID=A0A1H6FHM9_9GAMM|nr:hypothetical protein [Candidatus Venteria ishoeyi]MDM8545111.1 hypothetical protein [Candidatus Venteria ishoeyi]SEH08656.1 Uncharacterised protein [Candidatus Venteria ishoeyi]